MAMIEDMKTRISAEENLAEAYGEVAFVETSVDDEINKAIGTDLDVQKSLEEMKQKLLANPDSQSNDNIDDLKKNLES
jgi:phage shock protein A